MERDDLSGPHYSLGRYVRNRFGSWTGNDNLMESCRRAAIDARMDGTDLDADGASRLILEMLRHRLQETYALKSIDGGK